VGVKPDGAGCPEIYLFISFLSLVKPEEQNCYELFWRFLDFTGVHTTQKHGIKNEQISMTILSIALHQAV
jgi:hypothetical protein